MNGTARSIADVVTNGLCIGCGLCEAVTGGRVRMQMTSYGALRPHSANEFTEAEEHRLIELCPGVSVEPRTTSGETADLVWGQFHSMRYAWAGDPDIRFHAATGGVLTALGVHLLRAKKVAAIIHVEADPVWPMRSRAVISQSADDVIRATGSRYGPTAPLVDFVHVLDQGKPFAVIAKPCDLSAVHNYAMLDERVDQLCRYRLAMVCGGQSRLEKSKDLLREFDIEERELRLFRYRGHGNPGPARVETQNGRVFEKSYLDLWADESGWQLETRCKLCPDALGEAADVAAADVWPGGNPEGDDEGYNGIVVRGDAGVALVDAAVAAGDLILGEPIRTQQFNDFQPHQVRKKEALKARYRGRAAAGLANIQTNGLRLDELDQQLADDRRQSQFEGAKARALGGKFSEPLADLAGE